MQQCRKILCQPALEVPTFVAVVEVDADLELEARQALGKPDAVVAAIPVRPQLDGGHHLAGHHLERAHLAVHVDSDLDRLPLARGPAHYH